MRNIVGNMLEMDMKASSDKPCNIISNNRCNIQQQLSILVNHNDKNNVDNNNNDNVSNYNNTG